jgi:hypothetical protein
MTDRKTIIIALSLLVSASPWAADQKTWEPVREEQGITVDRILDKESSVVKFRGRTVVHAPISSLMAVLFDIRTQPQWNSTGYDMRVLQKKSDTELWFYSSNKVPWPFKDRDFVTKLETRINNRHRYIEVRGSEAAHVMAPPHPKRVRMPVSRINWKFEALPKRSTQVTVTFQIDPGGVLPMWLMNKVTKSIPFRTLQKIRAIANGGRYDRRFELRFKKHNWMHNR